MNFLEERILREGRVLPGGVLKVDGFLNHLIDTQLLNKIGAEFRRRFEDVEVTKILTIESSGIAVASIAANYFNVPVLFAKKSNGVNMDSETYSAPAYSFTHHAEFHASVAKRLLGPEDKVLILDDFLATGSAAMALVDIVQQSGAVLSGIGIVIEKGMQPGGELIRQKGYRLESIAIIDKMDAESGTIEFRKL